MSDEHLIPKAILNRQSISGMNTVSGFRFSNGSLEDIPAKRLVARVLCERHNNALSPLDDAAARLFTTLLDFNRQSQAAISETRLVSGEDIERFMLKCFCAMVASGNAWTIDTENRRFVDRVLVDMIFANKAIPPECGMRLVVPARGQTEYSGDFGIGPMQLEVEDRSIPGITMLIGGFRFDLLPIAPGVPLEHSYRRPGSIVLSRNTSTKTVLFSWNDGDEHPAVRLHADVSNTI